jgi:hypothetical protein
MGTRASLTNAATAADIRADPSARQYVRPVADGKNLLAGNLSTCPEYIVDMSSCADLRAASTGGAAFAFHERQKLPFVKEKKASFDGWLGRWWQAWRPREGFARKARKLKRIIVCSKHAARCVFVFLSADFFPTHSLQLFAFDDDYSFGVLQSSFHWSWSLAKGSKIKADLRYTTEVWTTFPWPQEPGEVEVVAVAEAARSLRRIRDTLMDENDWSLRALHQAAEVPGPHPLKDTQAVLDAAVADAYGKPPDQSTVEFLLELNQLVAEDEQQGRKVRGPGLPDHLDPKDPRWFSTDCIEPPPVGS